MPTFFSTHLPFDEVVSETGTCRSAQRSPKRLAMPFDKPKPAALLKECPALANPTLRVFDANNPRMACRRVGNDQ